LYLIIGGTKANQSICSSTIEGTKKIESIRSSTIDDLALLVKTVLDFLNNLWGLGIELGRPLKIFYLQIEQFQHYGNKYNGNIF
jgi:hypothetical protein